ncbi:helix-turn-helix transcriptional regulator [Rhodoferax sp. BAB1]|uniref:helix-turn-helix transcriptional regulator n=1 Tax=Rhodoferax sp. BAB1 TaxID=2741720 RepID=UPI001577518C|nr:helix-turn-helix domain-containing protein [Rhodoferax sp. BAB1]QKO20874.1 helix-turn-helix domain-containing protein [Rhodoferax sp. BAB1]
MSTPDALTVLDLQLLMVLGNRLRRLRQSQGLGTVEMAKRAGISRMTLEAVESGDPTSSIGAYLRIMSTLGLEGELALLVEDALQQAPAGFAEKQTRSASARQVVISVDESSHRSQDLQSLALHREAVRAIQRDPALITKAQGTLEKWLAADLKSRAAPLWQEWARIIEARNWRKALGHTCRAQQLRQASPLPTVLPDDIRLHVLDQMRSLKKGIVLDIDAHPKSEGPKAAKRPVKRS